MLLRDPSAVVGEVDLATGWGGHLAWVDNRVGKTYNVDYTEIAKTGGGGDRGDYSKYWPDSQVMGYSSVLHSSVSRQVVPVYTEGRKARYVLGIGVTRTSFLMSAEAGGGMSTPKVAGVHVELLRAENGGRLGTLFAEAPQAGATSVRSSRGMVVYLRDDEVKGIEFTQDLTLCAKVSGEEKVLVTFLAGSSIALQETSSDLAEAPPSDGEAPAPDEGIKDAAKASGSDGAAEPSPSPATPTTPSVSPPTTGGTPATSAPSGAQPPEEPVSDDDSPYD